MNEKEYNRNIAIYSAREAVYSGAAPMISGALIQLFLSNRGVPASQVGLFNTLIYIIALAATTLLSGVADKKTNPLTFSAKVILIQTLLYLALLPAAIFHLTPTQVLLIVSVVAGTQTIFSACKGILEYKIPYQIIPMDQYTRMSGISGIVIGTVGIAISTLCSKLIEINACGNPYLICMGLNLLLLLTAFLATTRIRVVNHLFEAPKKSSTPVSEILATLKAPIFRKFLVPNTLRGISVGITNCIAMIALVMGLDEASASRLPIMCSLAYVVGSWLFQQMCKYIKTPTVGLVGSVLLCFIFFLPRNNSTWFLILFFIAYTGRILVDWAVPVILFNIIDPATAGAYNAWRSILLNLSSTITVYLVGILLEKSDPLFLLIPCGLAYLISMIWYRILYNQMQKTNPTV